ncbi:amino acid ABC transporter substrate-binding protein [Collimonas sp. NPDC087041]|uniref:amino acid ABC transporter substrate-binding protein n=1 Tax=Collimonas sp. NPDC087041 TaxID=3363960 RepID=UPI0037F9B276
MKFICATILLASSVTAINVQAQELTGTLKKINETGSIALGVRDFTVPFSYLDDHQSYQGYTVDLCMKVVNAVQRKLGLSRLDVKMIPVTPSTRIPLLANGTIDLECGNTTNNVERHSQVDFTPTVFVTSGRFITKPTSNVRNLVDLKGKTVAATSGSSYLKQLTVLNGSQNLGMNLVTVRDTAEGVLMVESGRAAAYAQDDIVLTSLRASSKSPEDLVITKEPLSVEPLGMMQRRNDPDFKRVVDGSIAQVFKSGEITRIYKKWFLSPIPPKGINLNWPMSPELQAVITNPTDSGNPADYAIVPDSQKAAQKKVAAR